MAADGNQIFFDASVRYQVFLERYKAGVTNRLQELVLELNAVDIARLTAALDRLSGVEKQRFVSGAPAQSERGKRFRELVRELRTEADRAIGVVAATDLAEVTRLKPARLARLARQRGLDAESPPGIDTDALLKRSPFQGRILGEWTEEWSDRRMRRVLAAFKTALVQGDGIDAAASDIREAANASVRGAQVLVRTAFNHVNAQSEVAFVEDNLELVRSVEWTSVLDTRTSDICRSNDGRRFKPSSDRWKNLLPAHPACRAFWTIQFVGEGRIERTDYYDWLRRQNSEIQEEALGPTRAKLFREGGLSKEQLVKDATTGQPYTLDELREREEAAFERAGVEFSL